MKRKSIFHKLMTLGVTAAMLSSGFPSYAFAAENAASEEPVSIRLYVSFGTVEPGWEPTKAVVEKFMQDNPNITVEIETQSSTQYHEKLVSEIASDTMANVFMHWGGGEMKEAVLAGKVLDVTDRLDADPDFKAQFSDLTLNDVNVKYDDIEGTWGVPFSSVSAGFYYNTELFEKAGITETPATWAEFDEDIEKLKAIDVIPWALGAKDGWRVEHLYSTIFYKMNGVDAAYQLADRSMKYADPEAVAPWEEIKKYADMGAFGPEPASVDFSTEQSLFQTGKAAMNFSLSAFIDTFTNAESPVNGKVGFFPVPSYEDKPEYANNNFGGGDIAFGIATNATDPQIEASWKLCKALCGSEGETTFANTNALLMVNTTITPDPEKINELFTPFAEQITKADACLTDVCAPDSVPTVMMKIRDTGVALVNNQFTPEEAGQEIDAEIEDYE